MKPKIKIEYSVKSEVRRVIWTLKKADWYQEHGYKVLLPGEINLSDVEKTTKEEIEKLVKKEYSKEYKKIGLKIKSFWDREIDKIKNNLSNIDLELKPKYIISLTQYGTGGSYNLPNTITINLRNRSIDRINETIVHEIIHLLIEPLIQKNKTKHWHKERIVDLIMLKVYPHRCFAQDIPNISKIDKIFKRFFPDIKKIIENTKEI